MTSHGVCVRAGDVGDVYRPEDMLSNECLAATGADFSSLAGLLGIAALALVIGAVFLTLASLGRRRKRGRAGLTLGIVLALVLGAGFSISGAPATSATAADCVAPSPTASPAPTVSPTATVPPAATPGATATPEPTEEPSATPTPSPEPTPALPGEYPPSAAFMHFRIHDLPGDATVHVERIWDGFNQCVHASSPVTDPRDFTLVHPQDTTVTGRMYWDRSHYEDSACMWESSSLHWRLTVEGIGDLGASWEIQAHANPAATGYSVCVKEGGGTRGGGSGGEIICNTAGHEVPMDESDSWHDFRYVAPGVTLPASGTPDAPLKGIDNVRRMYFHLNELPADATVRIARIWDGWNNCVLESDGDLTDPHSFRPNADGTVLGMMEFQVTGSNSCAFEETRLRFRLQVTGIGIDDEHYDIATHIYTSSYSICQNHATDEPYQRTYLKCTTAGSDVPMNDVSSWQNFTYSANGFGAPAATPTHGTRTDTGSPVYADGTPTTDRDFDGHRVYFQVRNAPPGAEVQVTRIWDSENNCVLETDPVTDRRVFQPASDNTIYGSMHYDAPGGSCVWEQSRLRWEVQILHTEAVQMRWLVSASSQSFAQGGSICVPLGYALPIPDFGYTMKCHTQGSTVDMNESTSWHDFEYAEYGPEDLPL